MYKRQSHNSYMYGNAFEAFIGAIYLDQGYDRCKQFMEEKIFKNYIDLDKICLLYTSQFNHTSELFSSLK